MKFTRIMITVAVLLAAAAHGGAQEMPPVEPEGSGVTIPELGSVTEFRDWLLTLSAEERRTAFKDSDAGPMPEGVYTGFMLSDRPNYEDFDISILNKAIMSFVFDRWIGKSFDGEGNLQNVLRDQEGFEPKDLAGTLTLKKGYIDDKKSWMALYGKETKYNFILDEFREIKPGYLFGITFLVPTKKGDLSFFECGLVRLAKELPKGKTATELILENISEVEPAAGEVFAEGEATSVSWEDNEEEDSYETKKPKASEGEPKVNAQDATVTMPPPEAEAPEAEAPEAPEAETPEAEALEDESDSQDLESLMD